MIKMLSKNPVVSKWKYAPFLLLLLFQAVMIIRANLFYNQDLLGYDASVYFLKSVEMWRQGTLFPDFYEQTWLLLESAVPLAAVLFGLTGDIFISYGIANIIIAALLCTVMGLLIKHINEDTFTVIIALNFMLSPFLFASINTGNPLVEPYLMLYVSAAMYAGKMLLGFICVYLFVRLSDEKISISIKFLSGITLAALFFSGISSGVYTAVTFLLPLLAFVILVKFGTFTSRARLLRPFIFILSALVSTALGIIMRSSFTSFVPNDNAKLLVGSKDFLNNLISIYTGFLELFSGMVSDSRINVTSPAGMILLINMALAHIVIILPIIAVRQFKRQNEEVPLCIAVCCAIVVCNLLIFALCMLTYGSVNFENRYLIPVYLCLLMIASSRKFYFKQIKTTRAFVVMIFIMLLISNISSQYMFSRTNITDYNEILPADIAKTGAGLIYGGFTDTGVMIRNLKVLDLDRVYKGLELNEDGKTLFYHRNGDYSYYDDAGEYTQPTVLLLSRQDFDNLPGYIKSKYSHLSDTRYTLWYGDKLAIWYSDGNYIDLYGGLPKGNYAINFPYTPGVAARNAELRDDGCYYSDGTDNFAMYGPFGEISEGIFDFTVHYEVIENLGDASIAGKFDIAVSGGQVIAETEMNASEASATIQGVNFAGAAGGFEHRVYTLNGVKLKIISVEIFRKSS